MCTTTYTKINTRALIGNKTCARPLTLGSHLQTNTILVKESKLIYNCSDDESDRANHKVSEDEDDDDADDEDDEDGDSASDTEDISPFWEISINHVFGMMRDTFDQTIIDLLVFQEEPQRNVKLCEMKAYKMLRPTNNRHLRNVYQGSIRMMDILRKEHVYKWIVATAINLREDEEYEPGQSLAYAVNNRHYLLDHLSTSYLLL